MQNSWQQPKSRDWELGHWVQLLKIILSGGVIKQPQTPSPWKPEPGTSVAPPPHPPHVISFTLLQEHSHVDGAAWRGTALTSRRAQGRHDSGKQHVAESASLRNAHLEECRRRNMKPLVWQGE